MARKKSFVEKGLASVGVRELRQEASKILNRVKNGEIIIITEWGHPVARLVPAEPLSLEELEAAGLVTLSKTPWNPNRPLLEYKGSKPLSEELIEERRESAF